jgi:hypothetical protein
MAMATAPALARPSAPPARTRLARAALQRAVLSAMPLWAMPLLAGCPKPLVMRPYPPPQAADILAQVRHEHEGVRTMRARAKADFYDGAAGRAKIDIGLLVERPDKLRLSGESSLIGPLLTLATDGDNFQLLDVRRNTFMIGKINPCNMARLIRVALRPAEAVEVLLGGVPLFPPEAVTSTDLAWSGKDGGREVLTLHDTLGRTLVLQVAAWGNGGNRRGWDVLQAEGRDAGGQLAWRVRHENFADVPLDGESGSAASGTVRLPGTTHIEDPPHKSDVRLRWRERELNPSIAPGLFHLSTPPGLPIEPDLCAGASPQAPLPPGPLPPAATEEGTAPATAPAPVPVPVP